jgi:hypothetical protein
VVDHGKVEEDDPVTREILVLFRASGSWRNPKKKNSERRFAWCPSRRAKKRHLTRVETPEGKLKGALDGMRKSDGRVVAMKPGNRRGAESRLSEGGQC